MKARFYRGPWDGKVRYVRDDERAIAVAVLGKKNFFFDVDVYPTDTIQFKTHMYHRTNHTHPDGSVFFEWSVPRRK